MTVLFYLLEANLYLLILYGFYRALLHRETFHQLNRGCLLASMAIAFAAPLLKVNYQPAFSPTQVIAGNKTIVADDPNLIKLLSNKTQEQISTARNLSPANTADVHKTAPAIFVNPSRTLPVIYLLSALFCLLSTFVGIFRIIKLYRRSPRLRVDGVTHVLLEQQEQAFSFFSWLFYHPALQPENAIIAHELVHIRQKHSLDLLLFDLIRAISWFNPVLYIMRKDLKLNHEYLADEQASRESINRHAYALLLIDHSCSKMELAMTHQMFSARQLKARILRLGKQRSASKAKLKYVLALPVLAVIVGLSAFTISKDYGLLNLSIMNQTRLPHFFDSTVPSAKSIQAFKNFNAGMVKSKQKPASSLIAEERKIASGSVMRTQDTHQLKAVVASTENTGRKWWAPQAIRDSVRKYEWAARLISNSMEKDGRQAIEILNLIQKESTDRYRKILDSSQKASVGTAVTDRLYHTPAKNLPDQATKDRLAYIDLLISRIRASYPELQRMIQLSNTFRSQVKGSFPMAVAKSIIKLSYYQSFNGIKIPAPDNLYKDAWVKNETERAVFYATTD